MHSNNTGNLILGGKYEVLSTFQGERGGEIQQIGDRGICRFCGTFDRKKFRKIAHTFPESLGNKWIISLDECDSCNARFGHFENELVNAVKPFLTLGSIAGKTGVIQTGRSKSNNFRRNSENGLSFFTKGVQFSEGMAIDPHNSILKFQHEIEPIGFRPRLAYKALTKMALSILPKSEIHNYNQTLDWLSGNSVEPDFPKLEVALSVGSVMNAPTIVSGTTLRRVDPLAPLPYILFILCAGSICLQIDLRSDEKENHLPPVPDKSININWQTILGTPKGKDNITINYSKPRHFNWASTEKVHQPIKAITIAYDLVGNLGSIDFEEHDNNDLKL